MASDYEKLLIGDDKTFRSRYIINPEHLRQFISQLFIDFTDISPDVIARLLDVTPARYKRLTEHPGKSCAIDSNEAYGIRNIRRLIEMVRDGVPISIPLDRTSARAIYGDIQKFRPRPDDDEILKLTGMMKGRFYMLFNQNKSISLLDAVRLWELPALIEAQKRTYLGGLNIPYSLLRFESDALEEMVAELCTRFALLDTTKIAQLIGVHKNFFSEKKKQPGERISAYIIIRLFHLLKEMEGGMSD